MIKRIIEISKPSYLSLKNNQLVIEQDSIKVGTVPIEDIGALILANPAIVITQFCIIACLENASVLGILRPKIPTSIRFITINGKHPAYKDTS